MLKVRGKKMKKITKKVLKDIFSYIKIEKYGTHEESLEITMKTNGNSVTAVHWLTSDQTKFCTYFCKFLYIFSCF